MKEVATQVACCAVRSGTHGASAVVDGDDASFWTDVGSLALLTLSWDFPDKFLLGIVVTGADGAWEEVFATRVDGTNYSR